MNIENVVRSFNPISKAQPPDGLEGSHYVGLKYMQYSSVNLLGDGWQFCRFAAKAKRLLQGWDFRR